MKMKIILRIMILCGILVCFSGCTHNSGEGDDTIDKSILVTEKHDVVSPSKEYILKMDVTEKDGIQGFYVAVYTNNKKKEIFKGDQFYRFRDVSYLFWGDNNTFWLYNGDLGTYYWEKTDNTWNKKSYSENKDSIKVPDILKQLRPSLFT